MGNFHHILIGAISFMSIIQVSAFSHTLRSLPRTNSSVAISSGLRIKYSSDKVSFSRNRMLFSSGSNSVSNKNNKIQILCLHGKGGDGLNFQKTIEPFEEQLRLAATRTTDYEGIDGVGFEFDYLTAPFPIDHDISNGMQWWKLAPGTRSFNAKNYIGFEKSADIVEEALQRKKYDIILAHSQGSILMSALIATKLSCWDSIMPLGYVLNGCAWPNPFSTDMDNLEKDNESGELRKVLFVIGEADNINPPEGAVKVRDCLDIAGFEVGTCNHAGGHSVPVRNQEALNEMANWIIDLVKR